MTLKTQEFMKNNANWREILQKEPYFIKIKEDDNYILLKYDQIFSDFHNEIVRECRGIIFDKNYNPVCVPFFKFGNYGESYASPIDWQSARVQEKIDGVIIKVWWHNNEWHISTNGTIDAYKSHINHTFDNIENNFQTYGQLFDLAKENSHLDFSKLDKNNTYMFELISPFAKVVVQHTETKLYHIGTRNNLTLEELNEDIEIEKPKEFDLQSLEDCIEASKQLPFDNEGYVVVDKFYNRIKIKSPKYVYVHKIKNNGSVNKDSILQIIRENEIEEFLVYYPIFEPFISEMKSKIDDILTKIEQENKEYSSKNIESQKDFALLVKESKFASYHFAKRKNQNLTPFEWFWSFDNTKLLKLYEL